MSILALVHPTDLVASEMRESLGRRPDLWSDLRLLSTIEDEVGALTEIRGTAAMVKGLDEDGFEGVDVAIFGGPIAANRPLLERLPADAVAILLSPDATAEDGHPLVAGVNLETIGTGRVLLSPHPGAILLAHLVAPLARFGPRRAAATLLEPVSVYGKEGLDEMFDQARRMMSFQDPPPLERLPAQLTFNVLASAPPDGAIETHLRTVLESDLAFATQTLRTGVFHSYGASLYLELEDDPGAEELRRVLGAHRQNELAAKPDLLGPIDAAAHDKVLIGAAEPVPQAPGAYFLWAVMDNLTRGGASNAIAILEALAAETVN